MKEEDKDLIKNVVKNSINDSKTIERISFIGWDLVYPKTTIDRKNQNVKFIFNKIEKTENFTKLSFNEMNEIIRYNKEEGLTTSQIRNVFGEMRRIQMKGYKEEKTSFLLLKPKLAYAVKRHKKQGIQLFYEVFSIAYDAVDTNNYDQGKIHFNNFMNLMEAIIAYHKYHGGKE